MARLLLLLALFTSSVCSFDVKDSPTGFTVSIGSFILLDHSRESPILFVGSGDLSITEDSGNFFINNKIFSRVPLYTYALSQDANDWLVDLTEGDFSVRLRLSSSDASNLEITVDSVSPGLTYYWLRVYASTDEEIYGGGEQFSYVNLRERGGRNQNFFPIWINEQGVGRDKRTLTTFMADTRADDAGGDYFTTYFAQPTFISTRNYYFHHDGTNYAALDFSEDKFHEIFVYEQPKKFTLSVSGSLESTVRSLANFLGHMPELPEWTQEKIIVSLQGGTKVLREKYQLAKDSNLPISGIWIQDWSGQKVTSFGTRVNWDWKWSKDLYPGLDQIIKDWAKEGVRILGYINPNLDVVGDLFHEAKTKGYLVKNSTGDVYLRRSITLIFGQVDFTNPAAYQWYKNVIKTNMIGLGLGGWMADFGEYLAVDAVLHDGRTGMQAHNEWPALWAKLNREAVEETNKLGEVVFFTRSGFTGTSNYSTLLWNGDQNVDFSLADGIRSAIYGSIGAGLNGMTFSHFDIGGYTTASQFGLVRSQELLLRSAEFAVFTSFFRTHEGNQISSNVQWYTNSTVKAFAVQARYFALLADYRKAVGKESVAAKLPTMRLTSLVFPKNPVLVPFDQYMFGNDLLVAPVYLEKATSRSVTLPQLPAGEKWVHIWTGVEQAGSQTLDVQAPLGQPPVFYRSNSNFVGTFEKFKAAARDDDVSTPAGDPDSASVWGLSLALTFFSGFILLVVARLRDI